MKNYSNTDLNFYNTERLNNKKPNKLIRISDESEIVNLTQKLSKGDILIPTEVETFLNVK